MKQENRQVFAIQPPDDRAFTFLKVVAEVIDGQLVMSRNPRRDFPTEGNVYVDERYWVPEGVGAIWRVQHTGTAAEGVRHAEYSVISRGQILPYEIIPIAQRSDAPDAIREQLLDGRDIGYVPASSILVHLGDNAVIGPIRCEPLDSPDGFGFRCRLDAFNEPLGLWQDIEELSPVSFFDDAKDARQFTSHLTLPANERYLDCAPLDYAIRATLKAARENESVRNEVNKRNVEALTREVVALSNSSRVKRRIERVVKSLNERALSEAAIDALRDHLSNSSVVQEELKALREAARAQAKAELLNDQKQLASAVKELSSQRDSLSRELVELEARRSRIEGDIIATVENVSDRVRLRVEEIATEPAALLAEVALIRPFLSAPSPTTRSDAVSTATAESTGAPRIGLPQIVSTASAVQVEARSTLFSNLEQSLTAAKLSPASAKRVVREILAAATTGQMIMFSGSIANELARAVATTVAAEAAHEYRVPVGLFDGEYLATQFQRIVAMCNASGLIGALVIEGLNRSATEAYAEEIRKYVAHNQLSGDAKQSTIVLGTLSRGPSTIPITPTLCELGPIIDTDCLTLGSKSTTMVPGRVAIGEWNAWCAPAQNGDRRIDLDEPTLNSMEGEASVLWRRIVQNALAALSVLENPAGSTSLQSIAYGWLVPRAHACGVSPDQFISALRAQTSSSTPDPRLARLLARLYPEVSSS